MADYNRIDITTDGQLEEHACGVVVTPGEFVARTASGVGLPTAGEQVSLIVLEDFFQGKTIDDDYASGDQARCLAFKKGDIVWAWLVDEQNIAAGDELEVNAAGRLIAKNTGDVVAIAEETLDLTGAAGDARLLVRIA